MVILVISLSFQVECFLNLQLRASTFPCWRNIEYLIMEERGYWGGLFQLFSAGGLFQSIANVIV
jgi:hypothetical protein